MPFPMLAEQIKAPLVGDDLTVLAGGTLRRVNVVPDLVVEAVGNRNTAGRQLASSLSIISAMCGDSEPEPG